VIFRAGSVERLIPARFSDLVTAGRCGCPKRRLWHPCRRPGRGGWDAGPEKAPVDLGSTGAWM